jgi:hypothetical protein
LVDKPGLGMWVEGHCELTTLDKLPHLLTPGSLYDVRGC